MEQSLPRTASPLLRTRFSASSLFLLALLLLSLADALRPPAPSPVAMIDEGKPVLEYLLLTPSISADLAEETTLTPLQLGIARSIARLEATQLRRLERESLPIISDPRLTLEQKRAAIQHMGYNQRVAAITRTSGQILSLLLDAKSLTALSAWMARRWRLEQAAHGITSFSPRQAERSYKIFATRYDSGGRYAVALPDKCLKFANAGNHVCDSDGYQVNQGYMVILSYDGSTGAEVWESGPWNVDDNYWSTLGDPQPRRMFADLPLGMPEAQAAYFDGYNGGVDQFGRVVSAPFGIDLARQVSIDIGLEPGNNDWITVSYMWTDGWGKKPKGGQEQGATSALVTPLPPPVQTSTPNPDGSIVHEVQPGQALWSIAAIYEVTLQEIYQLNGLNESSFIHPGDKLVIHAAPPSPTPTHTLTPSPTKPPTPTKAPPTRTPLPGTPMQGVTPTLDATPTPTPASAAASLDPVLLILIGGGALGLGLLLLGTLVRRR